MTMQTINERKDLIIKQLRNSLLGIDVFDLPQNPNELINSNKYATIYISYGGANGSEREKETQEMLESWNIYLCIKTNGIIEHGYDLIDEIISALCKSNFSVDNYRPYWTNTLPRGFNEGEWFFDIDFILPVRIIF